MMGIAVFGGNPELQLHPDCAPGRGAGHSADCALALKMVRAYLWVVWLDSVHSADSPVLFCYIRIYYGI